MCISYTNTKLNTKKSTGRDMMQQLTFLKQKHLRLAYQIAETSLVYTVSQAQKVVKTIVLNQGKTMFRWASGARRKKRGIRKMPCGKHGSQKYDIKTEHTIYRFSFVLLTHDKLLPL